MTMPNQDEATQFPEFPTLYTESDRQRLANLRQQAQEMKDIYHQNYTQEAWSQKSWLERAARRVGYAATAPMEVLPGIDRPLITPEEVEKQRLALKEEIDELTRREYVIDRLPGILDDMRALALMGSPITDTTELNQRFKDISQWFTPEEEGFLVRYGQALSKATPEEIASGEFWQGELPITPVDYSEYLQSKYMSPEQLMTSVAFSKDTERIAETLKMAFPPEEDVSLAPEEIQENLKQKFLQEFKDYGLEFDEADPTLSMEKLANMKLQVDGLPINLTDDETGELIQGATFYPSYGDLPATVWMGDELLGVISEENQQFLTFDLATGKPLETDEQGAVPQETEKMPWYKSMLNTVYGSIRGLYHSVVDAVTVVIPLTVLDEVANFSFGVLPPQNRETWEGVYAEEVRAGRLTQEEADRMLAQLDERGYEYKDNKYKDWVVDKIEEAEVTISEWYVKTVESRLLWEMEHPEWQVAPQYRVPITDRFSQDGYWKTFTDLPYMTHTIMEIVPSMAVSLGTAAVVGGLTRNPKLGLTAGAAVVGAMEANSIAQELVAEGVDPTEAAKYAAALIPIMGGLEMASGYVFLRALAPGLASKFLGPTIRKELVHLTRAQLLKQGIVAATKSQVTETMTEVAQQAVGNVVLAHEGVISSWYQDLDEVTIRTACGMLPMAVFGGGGHVNYLYRNMPPEMKSEVEARQKELEDAGLTPEQAELKAVVEAMETPQGQEVYKQTINELKPIVQAEMNSPEIIQNLRQIDSQLYMEQLGLDTINSKIKTIKSSITRRENTLAKTIDPAKRQQRQLALQQLKQQLAYYEEQARDFQQKIAQLKEEQRMYDLKAEQEKILTGRIWDNLSPEARKVYTDSVGLSTDTVKKRWSELSDQERMALERDVTPVSAIGEERERVATLWNSLSEADRLDLAIKSGIAKATAKRYWMNLTDTQQEMVIRAVEERTITVKEEEIAPVEEAQPEHLLTRRGEVSEDGAYFGIRGQTMYEGGKDYVLAPDAKLADPRDPKICEALLRETMKDERLTKEERQRLQEELDYTLEKQEGYVDYKLFDELPMADAARRLGYDAVLVQENQDYPGQPTSVFVLNVEKVKGETQPAREEAQLSPNENMRDVWDSGLENNPLRTTPDKSSAGAFLSYMIEAAGDLIREFGKTSPAQDYINEKFNRLKNSLKDKEWGYVLTEEEGTALDKVNEMIDQLPANTDLTFALKNLVKSVAERDPGKVGQWLDTLEEVRMGEEAQPAQPGEGRWSWGAEPAATIPGEPVEFLNPDENLENFDAYIAEEEHRDGTKSWRAFNPEGVTIPNPQTGRPYFDTVEAARAEAEAYVKKTAPTPEPVKPPIVPPTVAELREIGSMWNRMTEAERLDLANRSGVAKNTSKKAWKFLTDTQQEILGRRLLDTADAPAVQVQKIVQMSEEYVAESRAKIALVRAHDHTVQDIKNIAEGKGTVKVYHGAPTAFAQALVEQGPNYPYNVLDVALKVAETYGLTWEEFKPYAHRWSESFPTMSTAPAEVASRWAYTFPQGEVLSDLNQAARLVVEAKRRAEKTGRTIEEEYNLMHEEVSQWFHKPDTPKDAIVSWTADLLGLPDLFMPKDRTGALVELEIDAADLSEHTRTGARRLLSYYEKGEITEEQLLNNWNTSYQDMKIDPAKIKSRRLAVEGIPYYAGDVVSGQIRSYPEFLGLEAQRAKPRDRFGELRQPSFDAQRAAVDNALADDSNKTIRRRLQKKPDIGKIKDKSLPWEGLSSPQVLRKFLSGLFDTKDVLINLQHKFGLPFVDLFLRIRTADAAAQKFINETLNRVTKDARLMKLLQDEKIQARIEQYISSKNPNLKGVEAPTDMTPDEMRLAHAIEDIFQMVSPKVSILAFERAYILHQREAKTVEDLVKTIMKEMKLPESAVMDVAAMVELTQRGDIATRDSFLATSGWGLISQGYTPWMVVQPQLGTTGGRGVRGGARLLHRYGVEIPGMDKTMWQRVDTYLHQIEAQWRLREPLQELEYFLSVIEPKISNPQSMYNDMTSMISEVQHLPPDGIHWTGVNTIFRIYSAMASAVFIHPLLLLRNSMQPIVFNPFRTYLFRPMKFFLPQNTIQSARIWYDTYVSQMAGIERDILYQGYKPIWAGLPGVGKPYLRLVRLIQRVNPYGKSDNVPRFLSFKAGTIKAYEAIQKYKKHGNVDRLIKESGMGLWRKGVQDQFLEMVAMGDRKVDFGLDGLRNLTGYEAAAFLNGTETADRTHFMYKRWQRAKIEHGVFGRLTFNLLTFTRSYWTRHYFNMEKVVSKDAPVNERLGAFRDTCAMVVMGAIVSSYLEELTGRDYKSYWVGDVLWTELGGLALGGVNDLGQSVFQFTRILDPTVEGEDKKNAIQQFIRGLRRNAETQLPLFRNFLDSIEAATGWDGIDKKAAQALVKLIDSEYSPQEQEQIQMTAMEKFTKAVLDAEMPDLDKLEATQELMSQKWEELGYINATTGDEYLLKEYLADLKKNTSEFPRDMICRENGFSELDEYAMDYLLHLEEYESLPTLPEGIRKAYRLENPDFELQLVFWENYLQSVFFLGTEEGNALIEGMARLDEYFKIPPLVTRKRFYNWSAAQVKP